MEFKIEKTIAILSEGTKGWKTELNLVSWSGKPAVYDIRAWNEDHTKCGKGKTFSTDELKALQSVLSTLKFDGIE